MCAGNGALLRVWPFIIARRYSYCPKPSISDLESRAILGSRPPMIVNPRGADVGVPKPLLHLGDVGLVVERVGGGGRAKRMRTDFKPELCRVGPHQSLNAIGRDRRVEPPGGVVLYRPEQRAALIGAVAGRVEIIVNERVGAGMQRQISGLAALAGYLQMRHAFARVPEILDLELAQLLAPQRVEQGLCG